MKKIMLFILIFLSTNVTAKIVEPPENPAGAEFLMALAGSTVAGATSWGGYLLWDWGSKAITPESWDEALGTIGLVGLYGVGYGVLIPAGAYSGISTMAINAGDFRPRWGAVLGAYAGTAAALPLAVMVLDDPTLLKAGLAAGSAILLPSVCSWIGYQLTPSSETQAKSSNLHKPHLYVSYIPNRIAAGIKMNF